MRTEPVVKLMDPEPVVKLSRYLEIEHRWVRSEEHRRKLIDTLVKLVDRNYSWLDGFLAENQLAKKDVDAARDVLVDVTYGTLTEEDLQRPFVKGDN